MLRHLERALEALLRQNREGQGAKELVTLRVHPAIRQALKTRVQQERRSSNSSVSQARILLSAALTGDKELASLAKQYAKTSERVQ